jgi:hypothetical protein
MERYEVREGWFPLRGSWEEAVLSWNEQVENSFRRREARLGTWGEEPRAALPERRDRIRAAQ